jgi:membrane protein implicated in regulation of membrane protease activity
MHRGEWAEWLVMLAALASLWPVLFGHPPAWYRLVLAAALAAMVVVTLRRVRRAREAWREAGRDRVDGRRPKR